MRWLAYVVVLPWIEVCLREPNYPVREYAAGVALLLLAGGLVLRFAPDGARGPALRRADLVLWNVVVSFLLAEAVLRAYLALGSAPAWLDPSPDSVRYRLEPAQEWLGTRPNSLGFYDVEWTEQRRPGVFRIVALGDSYSVGMVPYAEGYLTLVDEALGDDVELLNLGVVHTAPREYVEVLESDGLRLSPDLVLVGFFLGNDIRPDTPRGLLSGRGSKLILLVRAAWAIGQNERGAQVAMELEVLFREEPDGSRRELPVLSEQEYEARLWKHLRRTFGPPDTARMERAWRDVERALRDLATRCRERGIPIIATIAPDEVALDRELRESIVRERGGSPADFDTGYAAGRMRAMLTELDVPFLEFSDAIHEAQRVAPAHHLRGLHWNRHGNAAAAAVLAPWLASQIEALADPQAR